MRFATALLLTLSSTLLAPAASTRAQPADPAAPPAPAGPAGPAAPAPAPVRVAVVGFTGDLHANVLSELAVQIRESMTRQADPKALMVVPRAEMAEVYRQRGVACHPEDTPCIAEASDAWFGRLFVRGVVRNTSDGIIVTATLESLRLGTVAAAQTPLAKGRDVAVAVPILVRELLDGERTYRETGKQARPLVAPPASTATNAAGPVKCRCLAIGDTYVPGELTVTSDGLRFDSDASTAAKLSWRYGWANVGTVEPKSHGVNPALSLASKSGDALLVSFHLGNERDRCMSEIAKRRR